MNLLKNFGNTIKDNFKSDMGMRPRNNTIDTPSCSVTSPPHQKPQRTQSLSQISALHSHRNMKISLQIQLAESMVDSGEELVLDSKLSPSFAQCLDQQNLVFQFFVQYIDSLDNSRKILAKSFLQTRSLMEFLEQSPNLELFTADYRRLLDSIDSVAEDSSLDLFQCEDYELLREYLDTESPEFEFPWSTFQNFTAQLTERIEELFFSQFLCSKFYRKYEYEVLCDTSNLHFVDILYSSTPIASTFLEFMDQEGLKRFVEFLIMHRNFKVYSGQLADALQIHDRFFNLANKTTSTILELSEKSYDGVERSLQGSEYSPGCFDPVASVFIQYFGKTYFQQFLQSELFSDYLGACRESFKTAKKPIEKQVSTDSAHSNPDQPMWNRNKDAEMQLAFIDNYGRINSLFQRDPEPGVSNTSAGSKLTQVIKKLTLNDEEEQRKKEEDAWRIAQSIINDVCSVTNQSQFNDLP